MNGHHPDPSAADPILSVEGVGVSLSGRRILDDVRFRIMPGEFTGLIGSNGAGKTTLFRVILGLQAASAGRVLVGGRPLTRRNPIIGYVPQKVFFDPDMPLRARDVVALGLDGHRLGVPLGWGRRRQAVDRMLEAVDARHFADARVGNLSGGEQQRVLIAHALISRPRLLLLDEPLANLDIRAEAEKGVLLDQADSGAPSDPSKAIRIVLSRMHHALFTLAYRRRRDQEGEDRQHRHGQYQLPVPRP